MHTGRTEGWSHPLPARLHQPAFGLLLAALTANVAWTLTAPPAAPLPSLVEGAPWVGGLLSLAVGLSRRLPLQNILFALAGLLVFSGALECLTAQTGLPFGLRQADAAGGSILGMPWFSPLLWATLILSARGIARLMLKPLRQTGFYGLWVLGVAVLLVTLAWLAIAPVATAGHWWGSKLPVGVRHWHGLPWLSLPAIPVAALLQLAFVTPWLLNKKPVRQPLDVHPLAVWSCLLAWLMARQALAGLHVSLWLTAGLLGASLGATLWGLKIAKAPAAQAAEKRLTESD
jgi:hypothetical protein